VLIAKALQNLSNGVQFGQKEQFLLDLNDHFISENQQTVINFFESMSKQDRFDARPAGLTLPYSSSLSAPLSQRKLIFVNRN
jgi:hypothetical protein